MTSAPGRHSSFVRTSLLLLTSVALLTPAFAPVYQFYLAWVGLVPWLIFLAESKSQKSAFFGSWIAGTAFFTANMWWMLFISWPGMIALMIYLGSYWAAAGLIIRGAGLLRRGILPGVFAIAAVWVTFEWLRGIIITGLPWLYLAHTQTPFLPICQIADITGTYGVSFWVAMLNALAALAWLRKKETIPTACVVGTITVLLLAYGLFRLAQTPRSLSPGPTVAVVQPNYPQKNDGSKGADIDEREDFHTLQTRSALAKEPGKIDLVVWSETMMGALNYEAREKMPGAPELYDRLSRLAAENDVALIVGGEYAGDWKPEERDGEWYIVARDRRNTAYFFDRHGKMDDSIGFRYDKIHLMPWGEYIPGKDSAHWLYWLSVQLGPKYYTDYIMQPGETLTVFHLDARDHDWRFVSPICFEDLDAALCAQMFRPSEAGGKRADFMVNLTNDGWFKAGENAQHFQAAIFRSIENRAWLARSVNTGISGFVDSDGRPSDLLTARTEGTSVAQIMIDGRLTFFTRFGDIFAYACVAATSIMAAHAWIKHRQPRKVQ